MSNLGWYQKVVTMAKKVGGPKRLIGLFIGGGFALGVVGTIGTQKTFKAIKSKFHTKNSTCIENEKVFIVTTDYKDCNGLALKSGDRYQILNRDADAIMIEKFGDNNNPYFVSKSILESISHNSIRKESENEQTMS